MPFVSKAQQGFLHANPDVLGKSKLAEFDAASKGRHDLPGHVQHGHEFSNASYKMAHKLRKKKD